LAGREVQVTPFRVVPALSFYLFLEIRDSEKGVLEGYLFLNFFYREILEILAKDGFFIGFNGHVFTSIFES